MWYLYQDNESNRKSSRGGPDVMGKINGGITRRQFLATTGGATIFVSGYYLLPITRQEDEHAYDGKELIEKKLTFGCD